MFKNEITGQVFLTTHNPTFINELDNETTIIKLIMKDQQRFSVPITNKQDFIEFRYQFGLLNSDFLFSDTIVFVEGISDKLTFETWLKMLYPDDNQVTFLYMGGWTSVSSSLILSFMLQLQQNFSLFVILDSDNQDPLKKKEEILNALEGKASHIVKDIGRDIIAKSIYILKKDRLEAYFRELPKLLSVFFEEDLSDIENILDQLKARKSSDRVLEQIGRQVGKPYKKSRDALKLVETMEKYNIPPPSEIQQLLDIIKNSTDRN